MIEVKGLKHTYATKSRDNVLALKGVNFSLGNSGMYFIGGKSGCGKSTLLNLLGGLAKIQEGDIIFNGVSLKDFSAVQYDAYRASEVGIIFQEFNLIDNLTVGENIELQLNIARANADKGVIAESLKRVDLEGYEKRMPYELSGGQKQRVAIARQLAKGAKVILAGEPTGNLDSENATNVFETLKTLSNEIAVIVVSHDMESAYKYGDQIITLKDGLVEKIEYPNDNTQDLEWQEKSAYKAVKPHFPFKYVAKLARKNIFKRKVRFTISLVLSLLSCIMFCILGSLVSVDKNRSLADKMYDDNLPFYQFIQGVKHEGWSSINVEAGRKNVPYINQSRIENKYSVGDDYLFQYEIEFGTDYFTITLDTYTPKGIFWHGDSYVQINKAEDIKNILGYEMIGEYLPLDKDSAYITDYYALGLIKAKQKYLDGDTTVELGSDAKIEDLVGKTFVMEGMEDCILKVAGIIKTDYEKFGFIEKYEELQATADKHPNGHIQYSENFLTASELAMKKLFCSLFVNNEGANKIAAGKGVLKFLETGVWSSESIELFENDGYFVNGKNYSVDMRKSEGCASYFELLYTADGVQELDRSQTISIEDDEVILSKGVYETIFGEVLKTEDYYDVKEVSKVDPFGTEIVNYVYTPKNAVPPRVGETITLCLNYESIGKKVEREVKVKGVLFRRYPDAMGMGITYVSDDLFSEFAEMANKNVGQIFVKRVENPEKLFEYTTFFSKYVVYPNTDYTQEVIFKEGTLLQLRTFFIVFGSAFLVISLLMFINYISSVIADSKKTIGIIRAIGGTGGSIFKIYYMLGVLFWLVTTVVSSIVYMIVLPLFNKVFTQGVLAGVQFLYYSYAAIGFVALLLFAVMTLASLLPITKVSRKSPIEVIADK